MNLNLYRKRQCEDGIFSELRNDTGDLIAAVAEHAYTMGLNWRGKLPPGIYICKRGIHKLDGKDETLECFEVTNVPGHTGILIHKGNYPKSESTGCLLLGTAQIGNMVVESQIAFDKFMNLMSGIDGFKLTVY